MISVFHNPPRGPGVDGDDNLEQPQQAKWTDGEGPARLAALADADVSFGQARMFEAFRQSDSIEIAVFRDEAEAVA